MPNKAIPAVIRRYTIKFHTKPGDNSENLRARLEALNTLLTPHWAHLARTGGTKVAFEKSSGDYTAVGTQPMLALVVQSIILDAGFVVEASASIEAEAPDSDKSSQIVKCASPFQLAAMCAN